jgi:colicin import membrane protein
VVVMVGLWVGAAAMAVAAQDDQAKNSKVLLAEARKLYEVHKYDAALKRLDQVDPAALNIFEKGTYKSLREDSQKAIEAKAADEKAFAEGKEALTKERTATAVEKLSQASASSYVDEAMRQEAKSRLKVAEEKNKAALALARSLIETARTAAKEGKADEAKGALDQIKGMDVRLSNGDRSGVAAVEKLLAAPAELKAAAEKKAADEKAAAEKAAAKKAADEKAAAEKTAADETAAADK